MLLGEVEESEKYTSRIFPKVPRAITASLPLRDPKELKSLKEKIYHLIPLVSAVVLSIYFGMHTSAEGLGSK